MDNLLGTWYFQRNDYLIDISNIVIVISKLTHVKVIVTNFVKFFAFQWLSVYLCCSFTWINHLPSTSICMYEDTTKKLLETQKFHCCNCEIWQHCQIWNYCQMKIPCQWLITSWGGELLYIMVYMGQLHPKGVFCGVRVKPRDRASQYKSL